VQLLLEPFTSLEDYDRWLADRPDEEHYEVVDGLPVMSPSPSGLHQLVLIRLAFLLQQHCPSEQVVLPAPWDWVLATQPRLSVRQPDLVLVRRSQLDDRLLDVPLLAVEVLSPTSFERDAVWKRDAYAKAGLEHYWLVDPQMPQVAIYRRTEGELRMVTRATASEQITLTDPFEVSFSPADLLA
jgi:Uma2 family endonuclease